MTEGKRERVMLTREVFAQGISSTEAVEAEVIWTKGKPPLPTVLGDPARCGNWAIAMTDKPLGEKDRVKLAPLQEDQPVETEPEQVTPTDEKPAKSEDPQEEKALKGYDHYAGTHRKGAEVVVIRIDNHDIAMGIKLRMKGAVKKREGDMPLVEFEGVSDGPHTMGDSQLIPVAEYKGRVYKIEKKKS